MLSYLKSALAWLSPRRVATTAMIDGRQHTVVLWVLRGVAILGRVVPARDA